MSASSSGSLTQDNPPMHREQNPFVKAIGTQRKDFSFVTSVRKEVINIIEPYRYKLKKFEERMRYLERFAVEQAH